jgi:hypothetical protein
MHESTDHGRNLPRRTMSHAMWQQQQQQRQQHFMMSGPAHIGSEISRLTERVVIQLNLAILWCQAQDDNLPAENFVNYCERFNLWASGIGAPYSSDNQLSLAYKVRKAPRLESLFCDLLRDMLDDLTHRKLHHPFRCKADRAPQQSTPDMSMMAYPQRAPWPKLPNHRSRISTIAFWNHSTSVCLDLKTR